MDCFKTLTRENAEYAARTIGEIARIRKLEDTKKAICEESLHALFDIICIEHVFVKGKLIRLRYRDTAASPALATCNSCSNATYKRLLKPLLKAGG
jgi:hypothetical protein